MPGAVTAAFVKTVFVVSKLAATSTLFNIGIRIGGLALLSTITSRLFGPKVPGEVGLRSQDVMTRSSLQHRQVVYGQAVVSGPITYNNTSGASNEYLWYVIALAEGESEDLVQVWIDDVAVNKSDIDWVAGTGGADGTGTGEVSNHFIGAANTKAVNIWYYLGDPDQPVSAALNAAFPDINTTHRARGVTYLIVRLLYNADTEKVWSKGPPNNIRAVIQGRKVYDPRLDSTNGGTGSHRLADRSTWAYSTNPALNAHDYLRTIVGAPDTRIDWPTVIAAANDCDVTVSVPGGSETRFTCNGALSLGSSHRENANAILSSCEGKLAYSQGQWRIRASVWEASSLTITEDNLAGGAEVRGAAPEAERFNTVRGFFVDPARKYEAAEFPHRNSASYITRDGKVIPYDLQLPMTNTNFMAQRVAYRLLEQGNNQVIADITTNMIGAKARIGDVITLDFPTYGWTDGGNQAVQSENLADAAWSKTRTTIVPAGEIADPFGGAQTEAVLGDGTASFQNISQIVSLAQVAGTDYVLSAYAKVRNYQFAALSIADNTADNHRCTQWFDLANGEVGAQFSNEATITAAGLDPAGNGWHRIWVAIRFDASSTSTLIRLSLAAGDGNATMPASTDGTYFYGVQIEEGVAPSFYKKTDAAAVTTTPKTFRCIEWARTPEGAFSLRLREDEASDYDDPLVGEYSTDAGNEITKQADEVPPTNGLGAEGVAGGNAITWDSPPSRLHDYVDVYASPDNQWNNAVRVARVRSDDYTHPLPVGATRYYWTRAIRLPDLESVREPNSDTSTVTATAGGRALSEVPAFGAGKIGGVSDFVYTLNAEANGNPNVGEIRIVGSTLEKPDGVTVALAAPQIQVNTPYETSPTLTGVFYVMFSATNGETRFGGVSNDWGSGDTRFVVVTYDPDNGWRARNNSGTYFAFTPLATDCIIASCERTGETTGIDTIVALTSGSAGNDGQDGADGPPGNDGQDGTDGDDGKSVYVAKIYRRATSAPATPTGGQYNFGTETLTPPTDWSESVPGGSGSVYSSVGSFSVIGNTGIDNTVTWSSPALETDEGITIGDLPANVAVVHIVLEPANAEAEFRVTSAGELETRTGGSGAWTNVGTWIGNSANTEYDVKLVEVDPNSSTPSGTLDDWLLCSTTRTWGLTQTVNGSKDFRGQISFRRKSDNLTIGDFPMRLNVERGN